jgi:hypothetical protein
MPNPIVIKFYSPVNEASIGQLLKAVNQKLANGVEEFTILRAMLSRTTLDPEAALEWGLAHEIRQQLFDEGSEVISIQAGG